MVENDNTVLPRPWIYLIRMSVFLVLVGFIAGILAPQIRSAFMANAALNGMIVGVFLIGIGYAVRQVWRLVPEINWVNSLRAVDPANDPVHAPVLLAPMAALLRDRPDRLTLSPFSLRSLLDSLGSRLDESRDISRYLIGLLIFLGLLGTFWGLLETVSSVGNTIRSLDVTTAESGTIFEELKTGLEAPLHGMGTSFSSSLFGLAGSLVLGFLDLQASQALNRFYNDVEEWLSALTDIERGESVQAGVPQYVKLDLREMQTGIERINRTLEDALAPEGNGAAGAAATPAEAATREAESLGLLADAVQTLVRQMREEQRMMRDWVQAQSDQQGEMKKLLGRVAAKVEAAPKAGRRAGAQED